METKSMIGLPVKFEAEKCYQPDAGKKVNTFGVITNYIAHGCWGVKYSFSDGEVGESMIHASRLSACETEDEKKMAQESAKRWCDSLGTDDEVVNRAVSYYNAGDNQSCVNLLTKLGRQRNIILGIVKI